MEASPKYFSSPHWPGNSSRELIALNSPNVKLGYTVCGDHNYGVTFAKYNYNLFIYFKKMQTSILRIGKTNSDRCQTDSTSDQFSYLFKVCLLVTS